MENKNGIGDKECINEQTNAMPKAIEKFLLEIEFIQAEFQRYDIKTRVIKHYVDVLVEHKYIDGISDTVLFKIIRTGNDCNLYFYWITKENDSTVICFRLESE